VWPRTARRGGSGRGRPASSSTRSLWSRYESPGTTKTRCGAECGRVRTAARPDGARPRAGRVRTEPAGLRRLPDGRALHPAHRGVALFRSSTGAAPSVGFVHGLLARAGGLLTEVHQWIRALITMAYGVSCDETRCGSDHAPPGQVRRRQRNTIDDRWDAGPRAAAARAPVRWISRALLPRAARPATPRGSAAATPCSPPRPRDRGGRSPAPARRTRASSGSR